MCIFKHTDVLHLCNTALVIYLGYSKTKKTAMKYHRCFFICVAGKGRPPMS